MTHSRSQINALLKEHNLHLRRDLGQNFMVDANTVRRIAGLADIGSDDNVIEIGPGLGSLTLGLNEYGPRIVAVEYDTGMASVLQNIVAEFDNISVVHADAMRVNQVLGNLVVNALRDGGGHVSVVVSAVGPETP